MVCMLPADHRASHILYNVFEHGKERRKTMKMKKIGIALVVIIVIGAIGSALSSKEDDATKNTRVTSENVSKEEEVSSQKESDDKKDKSVSEEDMPDAKETQSKSAEGLKDKVGEGKDKNSEKEGKQHPGDTISFGDFKITYKSVKKYKSDNQFIQPNDGFQYLKFNFTFKNTGKSDSYIGDFSCYADGEKCKEAYVDDSASDFLLTELSAGRKKTGSITFEVPKNVKLKDIELEYENTSLWSDKKIIFLAK